tara:strand:- start:766 stop:1617 length:852 start_codon:yes stop_codon:yes gene_type:complete
MNHQNIKILNTRNEAAALSLIEKSFGYTNEHHYKEDFLPLFDSRFNSHSINLYDEEKLIGHLGYCLRDIIIKKGKFPFCFIGAIAIEEQYRGKGLFKIMMNKVIEDLNDEVAGFLLWSSENQMYEKYGFQECGHIYQWGEEEKNIYKEVVTLSDSQLTQMKKLYEKCWPNRVDRNDKQWQALNDISSIKIFIDSSNDQIRSYYIKNKGFDLDGIIHEYACIDIDQFLLEFQSMKVWSPIKNKNNFQKLWLAMARQGNRWPSDLKKINEEFNSLDIMIGGVDSV